MPALIESRVMTEFSTRIISGIMLNVLFILKTLLRAKRIIQMNRRQKIKSIWLIFSEEQELMQIQK